MTPDTIAALSRLLDQALSLSPARRRAWLDALATEHRVLAPQLRSLLATRTSTGGAAAFERLPGLAPASSPITAGELVGPWRLLREIGRGGMGSVWLAERADGNFQRKVALKLARWTWSEGLAERMTREREIGALLEHPNIARLYDAGVDDAGRPFIAMAYIDGCALDEYCRRHRLAIRDRLRLFLQVVRAVAYAHGRLVIHRDIKPGNVMVDSAGQAHLLDFGISKMIGDGAAEPNVTRDHGRAMTPVYASPEQIRGEVLGVAADVYSLGATLYELLSGALPHRPRRDSAAALEEAILEDEPSPASTRGADAAVSRALRGDVDAILARCLRREPQRRYASADALALDIERHLAGLPVSARPDTAWYRLRKAVRRHRGAFATASVVALALTWAGGVSLVQAQRAQAEAERARTVLAFLVDLFRANTGGSAAGTAMRQLPAETLLERGARLIDTRFAGQTRVQADLHGAVAGVLLDMGSFKVALAHAQSHLQALERAGVVGLEHARARLLVAELQYRAGAFADTDANARAALAEADDPAARIDAQRWLALSSFARGRLEDGDRWLQQAESALTAGGPPSPQHAEVRWARALRFTSANRFDEAMPLFRDGIRNAEAAEGPQAARAVRMRLQFADLLLNHGRPAEAQREADAAIDQLRRQGGIGELRAAVEECAFYGMLYVDGYRPYAEALAVVQRNQRAIEAGADLLPAAMRADLQFRLGLMQARWGAVHQARESLTGSVPVLQQDPVLNTRLEPWLLWATGRVAMLSGDHAEAQRQFAKHLHFRTRTGMAQHPWTAWTVAALAQNLGLQGQAREGLALMASMPAFDAAQASATGGGEPLTELRLTRAMLLLRLGQAREALALLPPDNASADADSLPVDRRLLRGQALCALGSAAEGFELQRQRLDQVSERFYAHSPELAFARAQAGLCALQAAGRPQAQRLADLAAAAFAAQSDVSPHFKQPLAELQARLTGRRP